METTRKARKQYVCDYCDGIINVGELYHYGKIRIPKHTDEKQTGIEYCNWHIHLSCELREGQNIFERQYVEGII